MKKISINIFIIFSTLFIFIIGTLLHFTYNLSNNNTLIGIFSSINESTWEHLKLLYIPMLITTIIGYIYYKNIYINFLCIKTKAIFISLLFMTIFYYTYTGILGYNITPLNISSFFIATIIEEYYTYKNINNNKNCNFILTLIILLTLLTLFIIFTFYPPHINLFKDPLTNTYGIYQDK